MQVIYETNNLTHEIKAKVIIGDQTLALEDYLKDKRFCNDSKHTQIRKHVLTATRNFDNRLKEFMKYIVMSKENPMNKNLFNYRVEFQARGQDIFTEFFGLILIKSYQMVWIIKS